MIPLSDIEVGTCKMYYVESEYITSWIMYFTHEEDDAEYTAWLVDSKKGSAPLSEQWTGYMSKLHPETLIFHEEHAQLDKYRKQLLLTLVE